MFCLSLTLSFTPSHSQFSRPTHFGLLRNFLLVFVLFLCCSCCCLITSSALNNIPKKEEERIPLLLRTPRDGKKNSGNKSQHTEGKATKRKAEKIQK